jgi:hypothetical protein
MSDHAGQQVIVIAEPYTARQALPPRAKLGTFMDFPDACWEYLQSTLNESLRSSDPFVSSLAVLNGKVGRQRLRRISNLELHPLTRWMLDFRMRAESDGLVRTGGAPEEGD